MTLDVEIVDPRFGRYVLPHAPLQRIAEGMLWTEGPVWFGDAGCLLFSDIPNDRIMRWIPGAGCSTYRQPSGFANGGTRDRQGRLVSCLHGARAVARTEHDGRVTILCDRFEGRRLNSPNDVVVSSDGAIWFTDPHYGIMLDYEGERAEQELPCRVYRLDGATGAASVVSDAFGGPNGLCFSPDERQLYIAETGAMHDGAARHPRLRRARPRRRADRPRARVLRAWRRRRGRLPLRRGRQRLDQRGRRRALRQPAGRAAGPAGGAGDGVQRRLRRPPPQPAVHLRLDLGLCDPPQPARGGAAMSGDRFALVTGAGAGIGRAASLALLGDGWRVALAGRTPASLHETASLAGARAGAALAVPTDVADPDSVDRLFAALRAGFGRLDLLFNNAGVSVSAEPDALSFAQWSEVVAVNLTGSFLCAQGAFRMMRDQAPKGGRIINNGSISAHAPRPHSIAYTATKHAVTGLTKSLSLDGRRHDIACGQIDIGNALTGMAEKMRRGVPQANGTLAVEPVIDVAEVARTVLFMATLPLDTNIQTITLMATQMPFVGRG